MSEPPGLSLGVAGSLQRLACYGALCLGAVGLLLVARVGWFDQGPVHDQKTLTQWLDSIPQESNPDRSTEVAQAIYQMGPEAVPFILKRLKAPFAWLGAPQRWLPASLDLMAYLPVSIQSQRAQHVKRVRPLIDLLLGAPQNWEDALFTGSLSLIRRSDPVEISFGLEILQGLPTKMGEHLEELSHCLRFTVVGPEERVMLLHALDLVRNQGPAARELGGEVLNLMGHEDRRIRQRAILVGGWIGVDGREGYKRLKASLEGSLHDRRIALQTLSKIAVADLEQMTWLVRALQDGDEAIRRYGAEGLGRLGVASLDYLEALIPLLRDPSMAVRATTALSIGAMGPSASPALPFLYDAMNNDFSGVGQECRLAIENIDPSSAGTIIVR